MVSLTEWLMSEQVKHENLYKKNNLSVVLFSYKCSPGWERGVGVFDKTYLPVISNLSMLT